MTKPLSPSQSLARLILDWDEDNPGEPDADVVLDSDLWAEFVDLAGMIDDSTYEVVDDVQADEHVPKKGKASKRKPRKGK